jgi:hypothetical protein
MVIPPRRNCPRNIKSNAKRIANLSVFSTKRVVLGFENNA